MSAKIQIRRLKMLDYARGFAILCMMFFHSFQFYEGDLHQVAQNMSSNPIQSIFKFFGRWAGLFVMISGTAFAYVNSQRLNEGKTKPKTLIKQTIGFGVILILVERITRLFFARTACGGGAYGFDEGPMHYSIVVGCVETGSFQKPNLYAVVYKMGAVTAIAFSLITLSCFISLFYREGETKISSLEFYVLGLLGSFFVLYSGFFVEKFRHAWVEYMKNGNVFMALFSGAFVGDIHALFPLLGYAFYGAMFGLAFTNESPRRKVVSIAGLVGLFYVLVGTHYYAEMGEPQLEDMYQTTPIQTTFLQVGMMIWVLCLVFWVD